MKKTAIVTTTINIPFFLESYLRCFKLHSIDTNKVRFIIVGDLKSPHKKIKDYIQKLNSDFIIEYWDVESQKSWISKTFGEKMMEKVDFAIPYNSIRRRNLGYLRALEIGADVIISVDDDNYAGESNWLHEHLSVLGCTDYLPMVRSTNRIVNPCRILKFNYAETNIYSRGYPLPDLFSDTFEVGMENGGKVALNMGLWIESPDVDAYTNILFSNLKSLDLKEISMQRYALASNNYMPVNTQNTAIIRELIPAFYDVLMDDYIHGICIDRYDDIWAGLCALKLIHRLGYRATFGIPLTIHKRNVHDFVSDLKSELLGMALNKIVHEIIMSADIQARNFIDGYHELAQVLEANIKKHITDTEVVHFFEKIIRAMNIWIDLIGVIL